MFMARSIHTVVSVTTLILIISSAVERVVSLANENRDALAELMLASYRKTIDGEGETIAVASTYKQSGLGRRMGLR